jgi:hypothetical protein
MPTRLRDLSNTDFGTLNAAKNKNIMRYNATTGKFDVTQIDTTLGLTTQPPQSFVDAVEEQIDVNNITFTGIDGGSF